MDEDKTGYQKREIQKMKIVETETFPIDTITTITSGTSEIIEKQDYIIFD